MARPAEPQVEVGQVQVQAPMRERIYDYFVQPQRVEQSPLHDVAAALSPLSADLANLSNQYQEKQNENDKAQGEQEFWTKNAEGNAAALKDGTLPAQHSKSYMDGYASQAGLNDALRLEQSIGPEYAKLDKTQGDPQAFDKWFFPMAKGTANPDLSGNPNYAKAFGSGIARLHANLSSRYVTDRSEAIKTGAQNEFTAAIGNVVTSQTALAPDIQQTTDINQLAATLSAVREQSLRAGMDKAYIDKATIDTVTTQALLAKDPTVLEVLKLMPHDPRDKNSAPLGGTEYGTQKVLDTKNTIQTNSLADRARWQTEQDRADKDASNVAQRGLVEKWVQNPQYIPTPEENRAIEKVDPLWQSKLGNIREGILKGGERVDDPQKVQDFIGRVLQNGGTIKDVLDAKAAGVLNTESSLKQALEALDTREKINKGSGAFQVQEDPGFKQYVSQIQGLTADPKWQQNVLGTPRVTPDGQRAINEFTLNAMQHAVQNPTEGPIERRKFLNDLGDAIIKGIQNQQAEDTHQHTYVSPQADLQRLVPPAGPSQSPQGGSGAAPAAAPVPPQPTAPGNAPAGSPGAPGNGQQGSIITNGQEAQQALATMPQAPQWNQVANQMSPEFRQQVESLAKSKGLQPQDILNGLWKEAQPGKRSEAAPSGSQYAFDVPGGGRVTIEGVNPEAGQHIQRMLSLLGSGASMSAAAETRGEAPQVNQNRVAAIDSLPIKGTVEKVAKESGMDPGLLKAMVSIESGGRATETTGSYHGLLQLSREEFRQYGDGGNIEDPEANLRAGARAIQAKSQAFKEEFGREPSPTELYLMHQQGEAGLRSHEAHPDQVAWRSMLQTGEGRSKGQGWAKQAVWGNVPTDMRPLFGSVDNITSAEFMAVWKHKLEGIPYSTALRDVRSGTKLASKE